MAIKFKDRIYSDKEAILDIATRAVANIKLISEWLEQEINQGYCYRNGKELKGLKYEKEMEKEKLKLEVLTELFKGESCQQYILDKEVIDNKEISSELAKKIIETRKPLGEFYTFEKGMYVGIDNSDGNAWTEEFDTKEKCLDWLNGEITSENEVENSSHKEVYIPDKNLEQAIREKLNKPNGGITKEDLQKLFSLNAVYQYITNLTGLEYATNLKLLSLDGNEISDISPIKDLTKLEYLDLNYNQIHDISPIKNLTSLRNLSLCGNEISDISPVKGLTKLEHLYLCCNQISDISPIKELISLRSLSLRGNGISSNSSVKDLINLQGLIKKKPLGWLNYEELEEDDELEL